MDWMIVLDHISRVFPGGGGDVQAVRDVSLTIQDGEIYGIVGFSGAGKSTLVRYINLLERPDKGRVLVNGVDLTALRGAALSRERRKIGMIFQQFNLFATRTVLENVAFPLKYRGMRRQDIRKKAEKLLRFVELEDKKDAYPSQLSGGQKQRVAIARALASAPKVLLCDEATSALDPQTTGSILKLLRRLNTELGITIVIITHQMQVVKEICGRVAVMENGRVVEEGDVFSVFANPQQPVTRSFIDTTTNLSQIHTLIEEGASITQLKPGECIIRMKYLERSASEALVSQISRRFSVDLNIICGSVDMIGSNPLGGLIVIASGGAENIGRMIDYLREKNVEVEVLSDARAAG